MIEPRERELTKRDRKCVKFGTQLHQYRNIDRNNLGLLQGHQPPGSGHKVLDSRGLIFQPQLDTPSKKI